MIRNGLHSEEERDSSTRLRSLGMTIRARESLLDSPPAADRSE